MTQTEEKNIIGLFVGLLVLGAVLAYVDHQLHLDTLLVETVHALVVTGILVFCIVCQKRNPEIKRYGWTAIIIGLVLMTIGAWVDLFDDPIAINWITIHGVPFGRSWEQAFIKKILGYTGGIFLIAYGLSRWIP